MSFVGLDCLPWTLNIRFLVLCPSRDRSPWFAVTSSIYLTPVAELFLQLSFEKIFKTQWIFKIEERFQVMLEWFKYSRHIDSTHLGSKKRRKFQKSRDFLGFKWGLYFSCLFLEKSCSIFVNQYFWIWEKYWLTKDWSAGFMTPFNSTSKADFYVLKIPCVLKCLQN